MQTAKQETNAPLAHADGDRDSLVDFLKVDPGRLKYSSQAWQNISGDLDRVLEDFYQSAARVPELQGKLGANQGLVSRLKSAQSRHWDYVLNNDVDFEFEGKSIRIGEAHVHAELSVQWYVASYGRILQELIPSILSKNKLAPQKATKILQGLISKLFIDMAFSIGAFSGQTKLLWETEKKETENINNLRNLARTMNEINSISMNMALLSRNIGEAAQSGQAISAAVSQMVASTEQITENSANTTHNAGRASDSVDEGMRAMETVLQAMDNIASTSQQTESSLSELTSASQQIGEFLAVIENISNQTNLLALNATIEAARAGEAGKGFAVVAAEVKELAAHSNKAAEDISARIQSLDRGIQTIQQSISGSLDAIEQGQKTIHGASDLMQQIRSQVGEVSTSMEEVSAILEQQTEASHEIAGNVTGSADLSTENEKTLAEMVEVLQESNDEFSASASQWFEADSHRSLCEMAKVDHILFKKRVVDTVMGREDWQAEAVPDHHQCRLGKWYDKITNRTIREHQAFRDMVTPHDAVHAAAKAALQAHAQGNNLEAFDHLARLDKASRDVLNNLEALSQALAGELKHADKRQYQRHLQDGDVTLSTDNRCETVKLHDVSKSGIGVTGMSDDMVGRLLQVEVGEETHVGEAVWSNGRQGGIRFIK